jgi:NADPH-dependent curcumin reductase CurA
MRIADTRSYLPPVKIGEVMRGSVIGTIRVSKSKAYPAGSYAVGYAGWTELAILKENDLEKIEIPKNGRLTDAMGVLGITCSYWFLESFC